MAGALTEATDAEGAAITNYLLGDLPLMHDVPEMDLNFAVSLPCSRTPSFHRTPTRPRALWAKVAALRAMACLARIRSTSDTVAGGHIEVPRTSSAAQDAAAQGAAASAQAAPVSSEPASQLTEVAPHAPTPAIVPLAEHELVALADDNWCDDTLLHQIFLPEDGTDDVPFTRLSSVPDMSRIVPLPPAVRSIMGIQLPGAGVQRDAQGSKWDILRRMVTSSIAFRVAGKPAADSGTDPLPDVVEVECHQSFLLGLQDAFCDFVEDQDAAVDFHKPAAAPESTAPDRPQQPVDPTGLGPRSAFEAKSIACAQCRLWPDLEGHSPAILNLAYLHASLEPLLPLPFAPLPPAGGGRHGRAWQVLGVEVEGVCVCALARVCVCVRVCVRACVWCACVPC